MNKSNNPLNTFHQLLSAHVIESVHGASLPIERDARGGEVEGGVHNGATQWQLASLLILVLLVF